MSTVHQFCTSRIETLTEEFLKGGGVPEIYECCVLTYLEVSVAARRFDPDKMWDDWLDILEAETGKREPLSRHLGNTPEGREKLVERLHQFRLKFSLPSPRAFSLAAVEVVDAEEEPTPPEEPEAPRDDLFDFFGGEL